MKTTVIFRKWNDGSVIAVFPYIPAGRDGAYPQSYEHVGQHFN